MSVKYLKVKVKSLAEEARIIRKEEVKAKNRRTWASIRQGREEEAQRAYEEFWGLRHHRTGVVRRESRASLLAYAFIRGRKYSQVETEAKFMQKSGNIGFRTYHLIESVRPLVPRIIKMVGKYGGLEISATDIENWIKEDIK